MVESKTVVLCADDFGLNSGISAGILSLVGQKRLSAVSCMTNMPDFISYGPELASLKNQVQIGLHFNLTEGMFLTYPQRKCFRLGELLIKSHLHSLRLAFIAAEFVAQLEQFTAIMQRLPDFIDGHQHVHQFPVIRKVILDLYEQRLKEHGTLIRSVWPSINLARYGGKAKILGWTGGKALAQQLRQLNIPHNPYFAGIYDFSLHANYGDLFRKWLACAEDNTLIMCHPGEGINAQDGIAIARFKELHYFLSDEFLADCEEYGVRLA